MTTRRGPTEEEFEQGAKYVFQFGFGTGTGSIFADPGTETVRWHYRMEYWSFEVIRKPAFILFNQDEREVLRIRLQRRFPSRFEIVQSGEVVGTIRLSSILRNKYTLTLKSGPTWTFRMPLFTLHFHGESSNDGRVWVLVGPQKSQWNLIVQPGADDVRLVTGLAFIHRQWCCYG